MTVNIYFTIFESLILLLFGVCLRHALKTSLSNVYQLITGVIFGVFLELATYIAKQIFGWIAGK